MNQTTVTGSVEKITEYIQKGVKGEIQNRIRDKLMALAVEIVNQVTKEIVDNLQTAFIRHADLHSDRINLTLSVQFAPTDEMARLSGTVNLTGWTPVERMMPEETQWVLHAYIGSRPPEYGVFMNGKFHRGHGPETVPTTHWLAIPEIALPHQP